MGLLPKWISKRLPYQPNGNLYKIALKNAEKFALDASNPKYSTSKIEGVIYLTAFCKIACQNNKEASNDVMKLMLSELQNHMRHNGYRVDDYAKFIDFVNFRLKVFEEEIKKTFIENENGEYIGGIITNLLLHEPLSSDVTTRCLNVFENMEVITKSKEAFLEIGKYLKSNYDLRAKPEKNNNPTRICPECGIDYEASDFRKVSTMDYNEVRTKQTICFICADRLRQKDYTFQFEE